ncbi:hypothetical protein CONLIGDRAFT_675333 [Coniochaeta ligniaria NRRL 30616]|uniref:Uncharacterized protein n=1 Tax=Coniochaeta ligniaria NRRL 30616 TaxID=1408157 RepID=A0A1J7J4G6_9PEZI|nr:hypothetical protein CONLIGDRAFT_675333 [Coniochaeta ligniaria NRRL 30616]
MAFRPKKKSGMNEVVAAGTRPTAVVKDFKDVLEFPLYHGDLLVMNGSLIHRYGGLPAQEKAPPTRRTVSPQLHRTPCATHTTWRSVQTGDQGDAPPLEVNLLHEFQAKLGSVDDPGRSAATCSFFCHDPTRTKHDEPEDPIEDRATPRSVHGVCRERKM